MRLRPVQQCIYWLLCFCNVSLNKTNSLPPQSSFIHNLWKWDFMFHTNGISVTSIILQMKSISPPALPILITAGFPIWSINGVEHPEPDLKLENSGHTATSNPTVITFMQTQGTLRHNMGLKIGICVHCFWRQNWSWKLFCAICRECLRERGRQRRGVPSAPAYKCRSLWASTMWRLPGWWLICIPDSHDFAGGEQWSLSAKDHGSRRSSSNLFWVWKFPNFRDETNLSRRAEGLSSWCFSISLHVFLSPIFGSLNSIMPFCH